LNVLVIHYSYLENCESFLRISRHYTSP
jgi:hypothetical protein